MKLNIFFFVNANKTRNANILLETAQLKMNEQNVHQNEKFTIQTCLPMKVMFQCYTGIIYLFLFVAGNVVCSAIWSILKWMSEHGSSIGIKAMSSTCLWLAATCMRSNNNLIYYEAE